MASVLKRKRGSADLPDATKRSKSVNTISDAPGTLVGENAGWAAAFPAAQIPQEGPEFNWDEMVEYDALSQWRRKEPKESMEKRVESAHDIAMRTLKKVMKRRETEDWRLSDAIGGRMLNADPVFTPGEDFLIIAQRSSILVYSTATSLLHRSIKLKFPKGTYPRIITYYLSPTHDNIVWIACSDGSIFSVDWTNGAGAETYWGVSSSGCIHMTVASIESVDRRRDVVFTTEVRKGGGWRITANELAPPGAEIKTAARTIHTTQTRIDFLKTANEGSVIVASSGKQLLIGFLRSNDFDTIDKIKYEFRVFESSEYISAFDLRVLPRTASSDVKKPIRKVPVVNIVVGDVKGFIYIHNDLLAKLMMSQHGSPSGDWNITPKRLHWHRQEVQTVKWSQDGNYVISGGSETVLVLWQLDTGRAQYLPHLTATIQNVVVSPSGSSYAIQLADNSAMVMSTAELEPTANIAGIQANVLQSELRSESHVTRVENDPWGKLVYQHTPAVIVPSDPSRLLLAVGQTQEMRVKNPLIMSNPYLQTFDLAAGLSLSKQALTRTNVTNINISPDATRISEPRVTHMEISYDGQWLATVDEWSPPKKDLEFLVSQVDKNIAEQEERREVYLKLWQWSNESNSWELVSRIDSPHAKVPTSGAAGKVLDLAVDPVSLKFATIGEDNVVRTWTPKTRKRDGVIVRNKSGVSQKNWQCQHAIPLGKPELTEETDNLPETACVAFSEDGSILAAAYNKSEGLLHLLDPEAGTIRLSHTGIFENDLLRMGFLGQDIITLSDKLNVFDLVSEETRSSIRLNPEVATLSAVQKQEMFHLAVDKKAKTYAITLPRFYPASDAQSPTYNPALDSLFSRYSHTEIVVFNQSTGQSQMQEKIAALVTALVPAVGSEGYIILDTTAEIRTILKKGTQAVTNLAQSTSAQNLDAELEETASDLEKMAVDEDEEDEYQPLTPALTQDEDDEADDIETPVVSQQQLSEIFDIGPSYALPPLEDMFYQVASLFSSKLVV